MADLMFSIISTKDDIEIQEELFNLCIEKNSMYYVFNHCSNQSNIYFSEDDFEIDEDDPYFLPSLPNYLLDMFYFLNSVFPKTIIEVEASTFDDYCTPTRGKKFNPFTMTCIDEYFGNTSEAPIEALTISERRKYFETRIEKAIQLGKTSIKEFLIKNSLIDVFPN